MHLGAKELAHLVWVRFRVWVRVRVRVRVRVWVRARVKVTVKVRVGRPALPSGPMPNPHEAVR